VAALTIGASNAASAQTATTGSSGAAPAAAAPVLPDWTVTLGIEGRLQPNFEGASNYEVLPYPIVSIRKAGTPRDFTSPFDGFSIAALTIGQFRVGPTMKLGLPRYEKDDPALHGLGDVPWKVEIGGFAEFWPLQWLRARAEVRQGVSGHHGLVADLSSDVVIPASKIVTVSAGPRLSLATAEALRPYFGVTPAQSAASGLPVYDPSGGLHSIGFGTQARQQWTPQWATNMYVEYDHLLGSAADSPIVARAGSPNQVTVGVGLSYTFNVAGLGF
jgi:outer membrane protein